MDLYTKTSYSMARDLTRAYSTSFSMSARLFHRSIRRDIYAIYGLVRIADEIVDTYKGPEARTILAELEHDTYRALEHGYSTNPLVHAFAQTATRFGIDAKLVRPFFSSMRMDISRNAHDRQSYERYIYGSAEVIGLMCLRVFCQGDDKTYSQLERGAQKLGSAYQKINFLRDIGADAQELGRWYFPDGNYESFSNNLKEQIEAEIADEFDEANDYIAQLPRSARKAVYTSYRYYRALEQAIRNETAATLKTRRIRVSNWRKLSLLIGAYLLPSKDLS